MKRFQFLEEKVEFDSIHPSLVRQSILNNNYGLYEVIPGIYQVVWDRYGTGSQGCIFNRYPRF